MKLSSLFEARDKSLEYKTESVKGKIDRVIVELSGKKSEVMTKMAAQYKEIDTKLKALQESRDSLNEQAKKISADLFDAEDEYLTRVVKTVSLTITVSKGFSNKRGGTDWESVAQEMMKILTPDLIKKAEEIQKKYTTADQLVKSTPRLTVDLGESSFGAMGRLLVKIKSLFSKFYDYIKNWGVKYDGKLERISSMIQSSKNMNEHSNVPVIHSQPIAKEIDGIAKTVPSGYAELHFSNLFSEKFPGRRTEFITLSELMDPADADTIGEITRARENTIEKLIQYDQKTLKFLNDNVNEFKDIAKKSFDLRTTKPEN